MKTYFTKISISLLILCSIILIPRYISNALNFTIFLPFIAGIGAVLIYTLNKYIQGIEIPLKKIKFIFFKTVIFSTVILLSFNYIKNNIYFSNIIIPMDEYIIELNIGLSIFSSLSNIFNYEILSSIINLFNHQVLGMPDERPDFDVFTAHNEMLYKLGNSTNGNNGEYNEDNSEYNGDSDEDLPDEESDEEWSDEAREAYRKIVSIQDDILTSVGSLEEKRSDLEGLRAYEKANKDPSKPENTQDGYSENSIREANSDLPDYKENMSRDELLGLAKNEVIDSIESVKDTLNELREEKANAMKDFEAAGGKLEDIDEYVAHPYEKDGVREENYKSDYPSDSND